MAFFQVSLFLEEMSSNLLAPATIIKTVQQACDVLVIIFLIVSVSWGISDVQIILLLVSDIHREISVVI